MIGTLVARETVDGDLHCDPFLEKHATCETESGCETCWEDDDSIGDHWLQSPTPVVVSSLVTESLVPRCVLVVSLQTCHASCFVSQSSLPSSSSFLMMTMIVTKMNGATLASCSWSLGHIPRLDSLDCGFC